MKASLCLEAAERPQWPRLYLLSRPRSRDRMPSSGGSRNLERGVQSPARKIFGCHAHFRSRERIHSWKAEPRGPSQKKSRTLSDSVVLFNYNFS